MIRVLVISTLYPNAAMPQHGLFVERRLRELVHSGEVEAEVVAPVSRWRATGVPRTEVRGGVSVDHPRFLTVPGFGGPVHPWTLARSLLRQVRRRPRFDVIDAHYLFPDGCAAALVARRLNVPYLLTARGTDVNVHAQHGLERRWVRWAVRHAFANIAVSDSLRDGLLELGAEATHCRTLRNGVDLELFRPLAAAERATVGATRSGSSC